METSGYTSVEINGEVIGLKFGMPANRMFTEKILENSELLSYDGVCNEVGIAYLLYFGYLNNCLVKDVEQKHKFGMFMEYTEEATLDDERKQKLLEIATTFKESRFTKEWIKTANEKTEEIKKKMNELIGSSLNPSVTGNLDLPEGITTK